MSEPLAHPTAAAVVAIHAEVLAAHGGAEGLRDRALLESAVGPWETGPAADLVLAALAIDVEPRHAIACDSENFDSGNFDCVHSSWAISDWEGRANSLASAAA